MLKENKKQSGLLMSLFFFLKSIYSLPYQGMLGATGGRFLGPSGSQPHRNLWPPHAAGRTLEFQTSGEGENINNIYCDEYFIYKFF